MTDQVARRKRVTRVMWPHTHNYVTAMQVASFITRNWDALKLAMEGPLEAEKDE